MPGFFRVDWDRCARTERTAGGETAGVINLP
jgi:hypothetical protein